MLKYANCLSIWNRISVYARLLVDYTNCRCEWLSDKVGMRSARQLTSLHTQVELMWVIMAEQHARNLPCLETVSASAQWPVWLLLSPLHSLYLWHDRVSAHSEVLMIAANYWRGQVAWWHTCSCTRFRAWVWGFSTKGTFYDQMAIDCRLAHYTLYCICISIPLQ